MIQPRPTPVRTPSSGPPPYPPPEGAGKRTARVGLATWLSVVPGLGQVYNRQPKRAAVFFFGVIALFVITLNIPGATGQLLALGKPEGSALGPATVTAITYDTGRNARTAELTYGDGVKRYIIAPADLAVGERVASGPDAGSGLGLIEVLVQILSLLIFMTTFFLALIFWYDAMHDARRTAQERNGQREPGGRWWLFHR
jgi:ribosomal L2-like protein